MILANNHDVGTFHWIMEPLGNMTSNQWPCQPPAMVGSVEPAPVANSDATLCIFAERTSRAHVDPSG